MIKQEELRTIIASLREIKIKTGFKFRCYNFRLKELPGYSAKDAINLLKVKRGGNLDKD